MTLKEIRNSLWRLEYPSQHAIYPRPINMCTSSLSLQYCKDEVSCSMIKRRLYTALYLFGIFVFPLIFQPWHIIQHHGHVNECSGQIRGTDHLSAYAHHHDSDCCQISVMPLVSIKNTDHSHDPCYICDYKFPVKDLPTPIQPGFISRQFKELQSVPLVVPDLQRVCSLINPRAPPCSTPGLS